MFEVNAEPTTLVFRITLPYSKEEVNQLDFSKKISMAIIRELRQDILSMTVGFDD